MARGRRNQVHSFPPGLVHRPPTGRERLEIDPLLPEDREDRLVGGAIPRAFHEIVDRRSLDRSGPFEPERARELPRLDREEQLPTALPYVFEPRSELHVSRHLALP